MLAALSAMVMFAPTAIGATPTELKDPRLWEPAPLQADYAVPGNPAGPVEAPPRQVDNAPPWAAPTVIWPQAATADVDLSATPQTPTSGSASPFAATAGTPQPAGRAGATPVWVRSVTGNGKNPAAGTATDAKTPGTAPGGKVTVSVADRAYSERVGVQGLLVSVTPRDASAQGRVVVGVDYSGIAGAFGGDWASRVRLVALPACALTTPDKPECRTQTPVATTRNDTAAGQVFAEIDLPATPAKPAPVVLAPSAPAPAPAPATAPTTAATNTTESTPDATPGKTPTPAPSSTTPTTAATSSTSPAEPANDPATPPATDAPAVEAAPTPTAVASAESFSGSAVVLAATAAASGPEGDYTATPLNPTGEWATSGGTGSFTWNHPVTVPPALGGTAPSIALGYNSAAVDGRTSTRNPQSSWLGDGWDYQPGYIERGYQSCKADGKDNTGEVCWSDKQPLTMSLNGSNTALVPVDGSPNTWRTQDGSLSRVERLTGGNNGDAGGGSDTGEYWKITTPDGTQYF
ncbi:MAG TPA: hypothetical protein VLH10_08855, partial [Yinghuangia sp.]|nr:hypothetical protein [Yinghuangia sp.]